MAADLVRALAFSGPLVAAAHVAGARAHRIAGEAVVLNAGPTPAALAGRPRKSLPPLASTVLRDAVVEQADHLVVLRPTEGPLAGLTGEPGWHHLAESLPSYPRDTPLWRSPQDTLGTVRLDPGPLLREAAGAEREFAVRVNLWFAPAGTDCGIHHEHPFVEVHTQIHGLGRMQKFHRPTRESRYEDVPMAPGNTHEPFCDRALEYPWHQYRADTDCVWLAVEYHEESE
ncbi:hypothetical protein GCM10010441_27710 [Kitasatospora paracochleata]|uniref:Uncharacterized protein n=1 Tax=Kitasatospora paracochleata TaxID=58354 RepID=A0ABT1IZB4_9ACTN|nr:hypothetical protein [Kitasatospora paracochleata]MCP2310201.1 hypothetical protein [Kitasatospora paracochleata]